MVRTLDISPIKNLLLNKQISKGEAAEFAKFALENAYEGGYTDTDKNRCALRFYVRNAPKNKELFLFLEEIVVCWFWYQTKMDALSCICALFPGKKKTARLFQYVFSQEGFFKYALKRFPSKILKPFAQFAKTPTMKLYLARAGDFRSARFYYNANRDIGSNFAKYSGNNSFFTYSAGGDEWKLKRFQTIKRFQLKELLKLPVYYLVYKNNCYSEPVKFDPALQKKGNDKIKQLTIYSAALIESEGDQRRYYLIPRGLLRAMVRATRESKEFSIVVARTTNYYLIISATEPIFYAKLQLEVRNGK